MKFDAIVIGGGAAGLFCAITAGRRGRRVLVIEHNAEVGRKIIISGGGRCNFTNIHTTAENFVSANPHFCKSALSQFTPRDFVDLVRKHRIHFYEKKLGQLFCRESSRAIVEMLLTECRSARVEIMTNCRVSNVTKEHTFAVETDHGRYEAASLIVACGGSSFPKVGATDFGYQIAMQFGLKLVPRRPSLVGLVAERDSFTALSGISVDANVTTKKHAFRENILFTHRGLSGPAILQISNYWEKDKPVSIDLLPDRTAIELLRSGREGRKTVAGFLGDTLPQRFATAFLDAGLADRRMADLSNQEIEELGKKLNSWSLKFRDTEGYDRAEVTLGGVSTAELSSTTMEAKKVAGLYFIGEVVDVTGWLGGYNFQWAWASGYAAGRAV